MKVSLPNVSNYCQFSLANSLLVWRTCSYIRRSALRFAFQSGLAVNCEQCGDMSLSTTTIHRL